MEVKTPTRHAADYLARGPQLSWTKPTSRFGKPGVWMRKLLLRVLRPYLVRHSEFEHSVVDALRELELWRAQEQMRGERLEAGAKMLRERNRELTKRVGELERELRRQRGGT